MKLEYNNECFNKEIDLIQSCINGMAQNSFLIKGWLVSLLVVSFALLPKAIDGGLVSLLIGTITLSFWYLDGFFLKTEKLYRRKYEWVILERLKSNHDYLFDLNPYNKNMWLSDSCKKVNTLEVMFSKTLIPFYGLILSGLILFSLLYNVRS